MDVFGESARQKTDSKQGSEAIKATILALSYHIYKCRHHDIRKYKSRYKKVKITI